MQDSLVYCPGLRERMVRLRALYERRTPDRICAVMNLRPGAALQAFGQQYPAGYCNYPDPAERVRFWDAYYAERQTILDDSIPAAYPSEMDQGLYGGLCGGEVRFLADPNSGWISSMVFPLVEEWDGFERLRVDWDGPWGQRYRRQLQLFKEGAAGKFGISHFILIDSLNFVYELFGATRTYAELHDNPDKVRQAVEFAYQLNTRVQDYFFATIPLLSGGTGSNMVQWMPGRIVSESVDPFHMTSVACFEEWGRGPVERILAHYDGGVMHIHGNGRHLLRAVSTVNGLKALYLGDDRGFPEAFSVLPELRQQVGDLPLVVNVTADAFTAVLAAHRLTGAVLYFVTDLPDADSANRLMDRVRQYRC